MTVRGKISAFGATTLLLGTALLIFVIYKAVYASFTHDESFTTLHFFPQPELDILLYRHPYKSVITNNHIFNTFMMKLSESIFGRSEWALRLPNILALVLYLVFAYRWSALLKKQAVSIAAFLLLLANPYLIDFFGLARGYGLAAGCMLAGLYYGYIFLQRHQKRQLVLFHVFGLLSVMSNFALLNFYVAALFCLYALPAVQEGPATLWRRERGQIHLLNTSALIVLTALLYAPFRVILDNQTVSFGGKQGFFADTILSLVYRFLYEAHLPSFWQRILGYLVILSVLMPAGLVCYKLLRRARTFFKQYAALFVSNTVCWLIALMTIVQHHWLGQDYLRDRFAVFLYPLFALNLIFFFQWMWNRRPTKRVATIILLSLATIFSLHTMSRLNSHFYLNWKYDQDTKMVMNTLRDLDPGRPDVPQLKTSIHHMLEPTMNLYRHWLGMYFFLPFDRKPPSADADLVFMLEKELKEAEIGQRGEVLFRSPVTGLVLIDRREVIEDQR